MNVKRIFFEKSEGYPSFELDNGDIKNPYFTGDNRVKWFTETEYKKYRADIAEEDRKWNEKSFFQKLFK